MEDVWLFTDKTDCGPKDSDLAFWQHWAGGVSFVSSALQVSCPFCSSLWFHSLFLSGPSQKCCVFRLLSQKHLVSGNELNFIHTNI